MRCPKCGGGLSDRQGYPVRVPWTCLACGLTSESGSFVRFTKTPWEIKEELIEMPKKYVADQRPRMDRKKEYPRKSIHREGE